ncbi:MAG TPA: DNA mismatch repair protein MutS [Nitrospirota bacterium]|nr:DNA mismatch repair protein MutS [Nitrospirota bacterium]
MDDLTPLMKQYREIKRQHLDAILLFRMGDFYEMFDQDAVTASKVLEITLTARNRSKGIETPLCGFPYHAAEGYIAKLIRRGFKVAVCEQVEDPKLAKGIVKREVIRVVTPGTVLDSNLLDAKDNNYLASLCPAKEGYGLAFLDISTGDFFVAQIDGTGNFAELDTMLARFTPREIVLPRGYQIDTGLSSLLRQYTQAINTHDEWTFDWQTANRALLDHFKTASLEGFGCSGMKIGISAAGAALRYIEETQKTSLENIRRIKPFLTQSYMVLDPSCQRTLELVKNIYDGSLKGTLLSVLDFTATSMGGRKLREWLLNPLMDAVEIERRHEAVTELREGHQLRADLRTVLGKVYDLERLISRVSLGVANARDLLALKQSFASLPQVRQLLSNCNSRLTYALTEEWDDLREVFQRIDSAIADDPPYTLREGRLIKKGYNRELDELRSISSEGKGWIAGIERRERERTGIGSLKVSYNKVFGYYIEVTKTNLQNVPPDYIRKQTLANAERFITPELKEYEDKVLGAEEKILDMEYRLFQQVRESVAGSTVRIQDMARRLAVLDCLASLAEAAAKNNYTRPAILEGDTLRIIDGRHPVIEQVSAEERFIPNDTILDCEENQLVILTGPNMAGKSTYMRQVAMITIMAQMGSLVPAREAQIGLVDRIFTRVGASDFISHGQSTFMVEMNETANILNNATDRSLIILDEIGRGTSTFDGISIAWAVAEYIHAKLRARTLFATHYHELTELALTMDRVKNYTVAIKEWNDQIIFLRRVVEGGADKSYGIQVARLAGLPPAVIQRAREVLENLEQAEFNELGEPVAASKIRIGDGESRRVRGRNMQDGKAQETEAIEPQLGLFASEAGLLFKELADLNLDAMTPLDAMNKLHELKKRVGGKRGTE